MHSKIKGVAWLAAFIALAFVIVEGGSFFVKRIPFRYEEKIARQLATSHEPVCGTKAGSLALTKIVTRIYPIFPEDRDLPIHVHVVPSDEVNAYAGLGGNITVNGALLHDAKSPEELAGILAHEMEHVKRRHVLQGAIVQLGSWGALTFLWGQSGSGAELARILANLQFTKAQEHDADVGGLERLVKAQVDVKGFEDFFERVRARGGFGFLSDHPSDASRAELAHTMAGNPHQPVLTPKEWQSLREICGH